MKRLNKIDPAFFFAFAAILLGCVYYCVRPPMQSPDEFNHFLRAYQISEGEFLPEKKDKRVGGEMPVCLKDFMVLYRASSNVEGYKIDSKEIFAGFKTEFSTKEREFMDFPNTSYYSPVSYLPQAVSLFVLRQLHVSVGLLYHGSRLFTFLVWVLSMFFVIRLIPIYKWLFTFLLLLPMSLYIGVSYSADTVTNIFSLLLIAFILKIAFQDLKIKVSHLLILALLAILLAFTKIIYIALLPMLFIIPNQNFNSKRYKYIAIAQISLVAIVVAMLWSNVIMQYYLPFAEYNEDFRVHTTLHHEAHYYSQKAHILSHKIHFLQVLYTSVVHDPVFYLRSYVGHFGTYLDFALPHWLVLATFVIIAFLALTEHTKVNLSFSTKMILLFTALLTYTLLILSQYLTWNAVASNYTGPLQGRYLVPILPLLYFLFNNSWSKIKCNPALVILFSLLLMHLFACMFICKRYFKETYVSKLEFTCGMEDADDHGFLKTSDPQITLDGGHKRTEREHRTGNYALALPDSSYSALYKVENLQQGDLVEIEAWEKGKGGEIILRGEGVNCKDYYFPCRDILLKEKTGWQKIHMIFSVYVNCEPSKFKIYVHNLTTDTIYFDDLRYSIKKFR